MQLVRFPPSLYVVFGVVILAAGLVVGRLALDIAGVVVVAVGIASHDDLGTRPVGTRSASRHHGAPPPVGSPRHPRAAPTGTAASDPVLASVLRSRR